MLNINDLQDDIEASIRDREAINSSIEEFGDAKRLYTGSIANAAEQRRSSRGLNVLDKGQQLSELGRGDADVIGNEEINR